MADPKPQNQPVVPTGTPAGPGAPAGGPQATTDVKVVTTTTEPPPTKAYRLKQGVKAHMHNGVMVGSGGVVHLTDQQFNAFRDKFELAE